MLGLMLHAFPGAVVGAAAQRLGMPDRVIGIVFVGSQWLAQIIAVRLVFALRTRRLSDRLLGG
jgi:hypothetical protein